MSLRELLFQSVGDVVRAKTNVSPLVVRVCAVDVEETDPEKWGAYAMELVALLIGGALDVSATDTAGPYARQGVQVTFAIPDEGLGSRFRTALAEVARRHGVAPYTSWTECEGRLRLDGW